MNTLVTLHIDKKEDGYYYQGDISEGKHVSGGPFNFYEEAYLEAKSSLWENYNISDLNIDISLEGVTEVGGFKIVKVEDQFYFSVKVKESGANYKIGPFNDSVSAEKQAITLLRVKHGLSEELIKRF